MPGRLQMSGYKITKSVGAVVFAVLLSLATIESAEKSTSDNNSPHDSALGSLWNPATDISSRDLFYGPGGQKDVPCGPYTFLKEDLKGTNPKIDVRDANGIKWKVKFGLEARPETAASRFIWAVGYFTDEEYYLPTLQIENLPAHLHRGQEFVTSDGSGRDARLKRLPGPMKKLGSWRWKENPFINTREFNGLRVMMALINNWDLKDINNAVFGNKEDANHADKIYMVSDLGASFGSGRWSRPLTKAKGNLQSYTRSKFIMNDSSGHLDFALAPHPALIRAVDLPLYAKYVGMEWIGKDIPRSDARWIGQLLAQLSPDQIRDAFRAAGYSTQEVEGFSEVILKRIADLNSQ
jgi:hypothetical protein